MNAAGEASRKRDVVQEVTATIGDFRAPSVFSLSIPGNQSVAIPDAVLPAAASGRAIGREKSRSILLGIDRWYVVFEFPL